ncbi:hypothetical protein A5637_01620 [Mycolicibacterium fortuitum]|nr:hypothetical protein A5637_01620 [Mycolicibacterium fortuitum]
MSSAARSCVRPVTAMVLGALATAVLLGLADGRQPVAEYRNRMLGLGGQTFVPVGDQARTGLVREPAGELRLLLQAMDASGFISCSSTPRLARVAIRSPIRATGAWWSITPAAIALAGIAGNSTSDGVWAMVTPPLDLIAAEPSTPSSSTPRQQDADDVRAVSQCCRAEQGVDGGPVAVLGGPLGQQDAVVYDDHGMGQVRR